MFVRDKTMNRFLWQFLAAGAAATVFVTIFGLWRMRELYAIGPHSQNFWEAIIPVWAMFIVLSSLILTGAFIYRSRPKWMNAFIGITATVFALIIDKWLHIMWYGWEYWDDGLGAWAYSHGDTQYTHMLYLFFISVYVVTGIVVGGIAGIIPVECNRCWIRFLCGPILMGIFWLHNPIDRENTIVPMLIYCCISVVTFLVSVAGYRRMFTPKATGMTAGRN